MVGQPLQGCCLFGFVVVPVVNALHAGHDVAQDALRDVAVNTRLGQQAPARPPEVVKPPRGDVPNLDVQVALAGGIPLEVAGALP